MLRLYFVEYGIRGILGDGGVKEQPYGRDNACCVVAGKVLVHGGNDAPEIVRQVDEVVINAFQDGSEDLAH